MGERPLEGLHVVLVPIWYPTPEAPTGGRVFKEFLQAFSGAGARVGLLYPDLIDLGNQPKVNKDPEYAHRRKMMGLSRWPWPVLREETDAGAPVVRVRGLYTSLGKKVRRVDRFAEWLERALRHYAARYGMPDVLNAHCATPAGWAALEVAGKVEPRPRVVLTEHTGPFDLLLADPEIAERTLAACRDADALCAVGDFLADEMRAAGVDRPIPVIGNPAAADFRYAPLPPPRRVADDRPSYTGIYTGRFTRKKGMLELADAIAELARDPALEIRWEFFGFFEDETDVIDRLRGLEAAGTITIHGIQGRPEIARAMRESHFLILPTHRDNCPLSVVEALSMGRPVVGTRGTGLDTYVQEGDGVLCERENPADLARAIRATIASLWDARAIAERAETRFGWNAIASKYAPLFRPSAEGSRARDGRA